MPVIGFLRTTPSAPFAHLMAAFRHGLNEVGFVEGQNVAIEQRWTEGEDTSVAGSGCGFDAPTNGSDRREPTGALAAKAAGTTIPIVFASGTDPVSDGLVASLNRPGGNLTGVVFISSALGAKRLEILRQLAPKATMIAMLANPVSAETEAERRDVQTAAQEFGLRLVLSDVFSARDIEAAFATFVQRGAGGLIVGTGPFLTSHREQIVGLAARHGVPAIHPLREFVSMGGLMSYGTSISDAYRQAGIYAGRILKGEKAADLPVMRSTKFEFVLNLKTAKALGLDVPDKLLAIADEVIE